MWPQSALLVGEGEKAVIVERPIVAAAKSPLSVTQQRVLTRAQTCAGLTGVLYKLN
ncbi:MAG: hypothetical protein OSA51_08085 [Octadecabacter sp.]|nr:hypothetical protein [Octadecabacter sp.]